MRPEWETQDPAEVDVERPLSPEELEVATMLWRQIRMSTKFYPDIEPIDAEPNPDLLKRWPTTTGNRFPKLPSGEGEAWIKIMAHPDGVWDIETGLEDPFSRLGCYGRGKTLKEALLDLKEHEG